MEICEFVSFSIAKKLKEKGFIGNVDIGQYGGYYYHDGEDIDVCYDCVDNADIAANEYLRPTISQVLKWLREEKKIYVSILPFATFSTIDKVAFYYLIEYNSTGETMEGIEQNTYCAEWKDAAFVGIEYVLDKLI